jgi:hypothetical protein
MNNSQFPTARKTGLVIQEMPDELLVYDTENNKAHCLNQTAAFVWKSCDGKRSVTNISDLYGNESGAKISEDLIWLAIDQLTENNLLEHKIKSAFAGQSRRDVIKKIGFASVVAIPIVASLAAPRNALALASCGCSTLSQCSNPQHVGCPTNNCTSGFCI